MGLVLGFRVFGLGFRGERGVLGCRVCLVCWEGGKGVGRGFVVVQCFRPS